ncbi:MAG: 23S rRNA (adenine(2503)-C(2))-methyltransferase RlmN [Chloroflexi bacterium]|nr:23S rRNA (adenine(2503)-C(2))-methyltransferase RlmN [Chloroflexota bacterium]
MGKRATGPTNLSYSVLRELVVRLGEPEYRAKQLWHWTYRRLADSFAEMTELPESLRQKLAEVACLSSLSAVHEVVSADSTVKALFALADSKTVESVLMPYPGRGGVRWTLCVSTQVGCPIGCPFCATGQQGFERSLSPGEIIDQVLYFARRLKDQGADRQEACPLSNLVFMGMGEPLANYEAVRQAIETLSAPDGFALSARHMVISTAGLVPQIKRLSEEKLPVGLAVSLHAADNGLRNELVPANRRFPLEELIPTCRDYARTTGCRVSFEYALFAGVNDSIPQARALARLFTGWDCHVNLIPGNPSAGGLGQKAWPEGRFAPPGEETILAFQNELKRRHITCTLRQPRGLDIDAGCGQLRSRFLAQAGRS